MASRPTRTGARNASLPVRTGAFDVRKTGIARLDWRDPYHLALSISWWRFFACVLAAELLLNSAFAGLYLLRAGDITNLRRGDFADAFFFSLETLATVGYGVMAPATLYGHVVSATEIVTGTVFTAVLTGLVFGRFARPKAKIIYADNPVICRHSGGRALMLRIANGRPTLLSNAEARVTALLMQTSPEGTRFRRPYDLALLREQFPLFALTWTLIHPLDENSPLAALDPDEVARQQIRLFITVKAWDVALAATVQDIHTYSHDAIRFGMRYQDAVSWDETGHTTADLAKLSLIEPETPGE